MLLKDFIGVNQNFKSSVNLYLSLNKTEKIDSYIPTSSSLSVLDEYLNATIYNKEQASFLIGPYGKGKSLLMLVLLGILTLERTSENKKVIDNLVAKIDCDDEIGRKTVDDIRDAWNKAPFLPVILNSTNSDLNQAFLVALNDALKRASLTDLVPDTFYSLALDRIDDWKKNYKDNYIEFESLLNKRHIKVQELVANLNRFNPEALQVFKQIYPQITAGSEFNPLAASEVLPLYKDVSDKLAEDYGYSGLFIVFDEFSKFIEGQDQKLVGDSMKLLQDICELAADSDHSEIFITMIAHKSIKEYGKSLSQNIINAFTGIEGRIEERYFITSSKNNYELIKNAIVKKRDLTNLPVYETLFSESRIAEYYNLPVFKSSFNKDDFENIVVKGCYPLNPIASYLLLNVSEKVAQNERTLFTFISNDEPYSMARFIKENKDSHNWYIGADLIYDYFKGLFKQDVQNELIHSTWLSAEYALGKTDSDDAKKVLKTLAIILAVNKEEELPATSEIIKLALSSSVDEVSDILDELETAKVIYKRRASGTFAFKTRAGVELKNEIKRQRGIKGDNVNYSDALMKISGENFVIPRQYNSDQMMTRYFTNEFMPVEAFLNIKDGSVLVGNNCLDGKIITLYSFNAARQAEVKKHVEKLASDRLVVVSPKKKMTSENRLRDYEIVEDIRKSGYLNDNNEILKREIPIIEDDIETELKDQLEEIYGNNSGTKIFYYLDGMHADTAGYVEKVVNRCCKELYKKCPIINNEIINRNTIRSAQTKKTRLNIINAIIGHNDSEDYYAGTNQEATVYRSLFVVTGIKGDNNESQEMRNVIKEMVKFIDSCSDNRRSFSELIDRLTTVPYGIRKGVLPVYLAYVMSERKEDLILYRDDAEIELQASEIVDLVDSPESYELYVSKSDIEKERYIRALNKLFKVEDSRNLSESRIKNIVICMQRWFRSLPQASRDLTDVDQIAKYSANKDELMQLRDNLQQLRVNPYELLFKYIPQIYDTNDLDDAISQLANSVDDFDSYMDSLVSEIATRIRNVFDIKDGSDIYHTLKEWYEKQSSVSKDGLHSTELTAFMSFVESLNIFDDDEISRKLARVITEVYVDSWNDGSLDSFTECLMRCKNEAESIKDDSSEGKAKLSFISSDGQPVVKYYERPADDSGTILRNMLEDTMEDFNDMSVNDRVSILLDVIEKVIKGD